MKCRFLSIAIGSLLVGCSGIEVSPTIPFVKMTVPSFSQNATHSQDKTQVPVVQKQSTKVVSDVVSRSDFEGQQAEIQRLRSALERTKQLRAAAHQKPVVRVVKTKTERLHSLTDCPFLMRDLSRPGSNIVYCRPE